MTLTFNTHLLSFTELVVCTLQNFRPLAAIVSEILNSVFTRRTGLTTFYRYIFTENRNSNAICVNNFYLLFGRI